MLKKVIIGIICFVLLVVVGAGIYIYTLDWNKHKSLVSQYLTQITGLRSQIEGNLKVDIFPQPKVIAGRVKFFSETDSRTPLVVVNEITANLELAPLFDNKFVVRSMRLEEPSVNLIISEKGEFNWKNVGKNSHTKSGNVEVSFDNIRLNNIIISFSNLAKKTEYKIPNISATVSAPSLQGPYKTDGKFIHNNSEIKFNGTISQNDKLVLNMTVDNAVTGSKFIIDGSLGEQAKGTVSFDTRSLSDIADIIFGEDSLNEHYKTPLFFSFQYDYNADIAKLDNFTTKYGKNITGSGSVMLSLKNTKNIAAEFNMAQFNLDVLETIVRDYIQFADKGGNYGDTIIAPYNIAFRLRSPTAYYKNTEAQSLNIGFNLNKGIFDITNFGIIMPGETAYRAVGKVNLNDKLQYSFSQTFKSEDLRTFASVFGIDLTKQSAPEYKKSVFKRALAENIQIKGNLDNFMLYAPQISIDSTKLGCNIHLSNNDGQKKLNADIAASRILFDKYLQVLPESVKESSVKDKFIYQLKLIPWNNDIYTTARIAIENAVYNQIPMENIALQFTKENENLTVNSLAIKNIAGASLEMTAEAENIFTEPQFKELSYNVKTNNFPFFASSLGFNTETLNLFKRKLFAAQGAVAGSFNDFSLSSVQKFGDTEFSYTGLVSNPEKGAAAVNGDLEIKTNNFTNFVKALNLKYTPDIPVTVFTTSGKIKGNTDIFEYSDINAYLGANKITGLIQLDKTADKPKLKAALDFDKFDADRWFNLSKRNAKSRTNVLSDFITKPAFDEAKIDYTPLHKIDFDITASSRSFIYDGVTYQATKAKALLKDGKLNVSSFETQEDISNIEFSFLLDTNKMPSINGKYYVSGIELPKIGGKIYQISDGILSANGTFNSRADTQKDFFENLNSRGEFQLTNSVIKGWDLDIIKFDLEQRKNTSGLEDFIRNSLKTGKSSFAKISGKYDVNKGNITANNVLWHSPVVDMSMQLNWNLSDYLFKAVFEAIYHNASFSDVLKFTFEGNSSAPLLKLDLKDTLNRISETEKMADAIKRQKENAKNEKLKDKADVIQKDIDAALSDIDSITAETSNYAPRSKDRSVGKAYSDTLKSLQDIKQKIIALQTMLKGIDDEKALMNIDAELKIETSKLKIMPKTLEDNYILDGKYLYDDLFNKISWVYNVASNNVAYYNGLSEAYIQQLNLIKKGEKPLPEETENRLLKSIKKVAADMEKISNLHAKMRDDYLFIVDTANIEVMKDNNEIAEQTLKTILTYTHLLDKDIINSIESFIAALELTSRDYDDYMVMPPENIEDIDITKPTTNTSKKKKEVAESAENDKIVSAVKENISEQSNIEKATPTIPQTENEETSLINDETTSEKAKKKDDDKLVKLEIIKNNLYGLINHFKAEQKAKKDIKLAADIGSMGLSSLLTIPEMSNIAVPSEEAELTKPVEEIIPKQNEIAEDMPQEITKIASIESTDDTIITAQNEIIPDINNKIVSVKAEKSHPQTKVGENIVPASANDTAESIMHTAEDLINVKKQNALGEIMTQVKEEEEKLISTIKEDVFETANIADKQNIKDEQINISDYIIAEEEHSHNLKRNPVIALEIGKKLSGIVEPTDGFQKRGAFKFKKARYNDVIKSFAEKPKMKLPTTVQQAVTARKTETIDIVLPTTLAENNNSENPFDIHFVKSDILPPKETSVSHNKFIFASNNSTSLLSGSAGKSMLGKNIQTPVSETPNKYVFAANNTQFSEFKGSLGKTNSLYVK